MAEREIPAPDSVPGNPEESEISPEIKAMFKTLEQKVAVNVQLEQDLIQKYGVQPNSAIILSMRLDLLLKGILSDEERYRFEIDSADQVHKILLQIREQVQAQQQQRKLILPEPTVGPIRGGFIPGGVR
jgi:hypothetical protein